MNRKGPRRGPQAHLGQPPRGVRGKRHDKGKTSFTLPANDLAAIAE